MRARTLSFLLLTSSFRLMTTDHVSQGCKTDGLEPKKIMVKPDGKGSYTVGCVRQGGISKSVFYYDILNQPKRAVGAKLGKRVIFFC